MHESRCNPIKRYKELIRNKSYCTVSTQPECCMDTVDTTVLNSQQIHPSSEGRPSVNWFWLINHSCENLRNCRLFVKHNSSSTCFENQKLNSGTRSHKENFCRNGVVKHHHLLLDGEPNRKSMFFSMFSSCFHDNFRNYCIINQLVNWFDSV